jgi:Domain of unknown function (DUF5658)
VWFHKLGTVQEAPDPLAGGAVPKGKGGMYIVLLFVLLQVADVISTNIGLARPDMVETNPLMLFTLAHLGAFWWLPKLAILVPIALGIRAGALRSRREHIAMGLASALYAVIVVNNLIGAF